MSSLYSANILVTSATAGLLLTAEPAQNVVLLCYEKAGDGILQLNCTIVSCTSHKPVGGHITCMMHMLGRCHGHSLQSMASTSRVNVWVTLQLQQHISDEADTLAYLHPCPRLQRKKFRRARNY